VTSGRTEANALVLVIKMIEAIAIAAPRGWRRKTATACAKIPDALPSFGHGAE
jgi:hypothetical protein